MTLSHFRTGLEFATTYATEETLLLTAFAVWEGKHPAGPVVVFKGKPTAYVISNENPRCAEILARVQSCLRAGPMKVKIDWKKGELLSAEPA